MVACGAIAFDFFRFDGLCVVGGVCGDLGFKLLPVCCVPLLNTALRVHLDRLIPLELLLRLLCSGYNFACTWPWE